MISFTVPAELAEAYKTGNGTSENPTGLTGFDLYYDLEFDGSAPPDCTTLSRTTLLLTPLPLNKLR